MRAVAFVAPRGRRFWGVIALGLLTGWSTTSAAQEAGVDYEEGIVYGTAGDVELMLDLAAPKDLKEPAPAVLFIHGGAWQGGKRGDMAPLIKQAAAMGYVAVTPSYRLAPKHLFPAQVEDCKCAVRWLRANASARKIDSQRIGAVGFSAGAHLAMMLGTMDPDDGLEGEGGHAGESSKVQAVVSFVGPVNLVGDFPEISVRILETFVGGPVAEKKDELHRASPINYVNKGDAPTLMFFGTKDPLVPYDQAFQMTKALTDAGVPSRVELLVGEGHGWDEPDRARTIKATFDYLDRYLNVRRD